jgi:phage shock protein E
MLNLFKKLLGIGPPVDFEAWKAKGAIILDVRTADEFKRGHIKGALNVPLQDLPKSGKLKNKNQPIITCCASGMRSAAAAATLQKAGFTEVMNGGGWQSLQNKWPA